MIIDSDAILDFDEYDYINTYKKICRSGKTKGGLKKKEVLFEKYSQLFVYSCVLGFLHDGKKAIDKRNQQIRWRAVDGNSQARLIALSVARHGDISIMKNQKMLIDDLEQRANFGMDIINEKIADGTDFKDFDSFVGDLNSEGSSK